MTQRGYKNPPKAHQFKKGKSGNPKGRPRKKKQSSSDPGLDLIASVHRELRKSVFVQENGKHREISKLDAFSAQLVAQSVNGKPSQQKMLLSLLMLDTHEETEKQTLEQLQSHDEDLLNELYEQLNAIEDDTPDDGDGLGVMLMTKITPAHIHARARSSVGHFFEYLYPLLHPKRPIEMDWYIHAMSEAIMSLSRGETNPAYHQCPSPLFKNQSLHHLQYRFYLGKRSKCRDHASYLRGRAHTGTCEQRTSLDAPSRLHAFVSTHTLCWYWISRSGPAYKCWWQSSLHICAGHNDRSWCRLDHPG